MTRIMTATGPRDISMEVVSPGLGVHRAVGGRDGWSVTHIASGYEVANAARQILACAIALGLSSLFDWERALTPDEIREKLQAALAALAPPGDGA